MKSSLLFRSLALFCALIIANSSAQAQSLGDYSALPESAVIPPDQAPRILLVLDTSGSMAFNTRGRRIGAFQPESRSYLVRQAFRQFLPEIKGQANVGLMIYGSRRTLRDQNVPYVNCNGYDVDGTGCENGGNPGTLNFYSQGANGKGSLISNVEPLDDNKLAELLTILQAEPQPPTLSDPDREEELYFDDVYYPFPDQNSTLVGGTPISRGLTPISGTLQSARTYLTNYQSLPASEQDLIGGVALKDPLTATATNLDDDCQPQTYVFFLTDGLPTANESGRRDNSLVLPQQRATELKNAGIPVWFFGFGINRQRDIDSINSLAQAGADQDAFFSASPEDLLEQLRSAFTQIPTASGSASGISVVTSSSDTAGTLVQAIYTPEITGTEQLAGGREETRTIAWTSTLSTYFLDQYGFLREDNPNSGTPGKLDNFGIDTAFRLELQEVDADGDGTVDFSETRATRFVPENLGREDFFERVTETQIPISEINPVWEAGEVLGSPYDAAESDAARMQVAQAFGSINRPYDKVASAGDGYRRIYSWLMNNPSSGQLDSGQMLEFVYDGNNNPASNTFNLSNFSLLGVATPEEAEEVIQFVRGNDYLIPVGSSLRSRTLNGKSYLLGDIVHSTAAQVDSPLGGTGSLFSDISYTQFTERYQDRRRMVYVGSNGGLLHAFNGGFWDAEESELNTQPPSGSVTNHELGAEIWAYAPMNLLPHLQWLKNGAYTSGVHVSYVDGPVKVFDVQAFSPDSTHIGGWGTILVVGMRLGGGEFPNVDPDANPNSNNSFTTRSAYIVLDVTDPEQPPEVIAEITHPDLGFTLSEPDIVVEAGSGNSGANNSWYLVFGSGPDDIATVTSTSNTPKLFRYRLNQGNRGSVEIIDNNISSSPGFVGNLAAQDWDFDSRADAVYFGTVEGTIEQPSGAMYRYITSDPAAGSQILLDAEQPIPYAPLLVSYASQDWVFFGSGRYLTSQDNDNQTLNSFYGIKENIDTYPEVTMSSLIDVTNVDTREDGTLVPAVAGNDDYIELQEHILNEDSVGGWKIDLEAPGNGPSQKTSATALNYQQLLLFTHYEPAVPDGNICTVENGTSFLNGVNLITGTADVEILGKQEEDEPFGVENDVIIRTVEIGQGYAYQSFLAVSQSPKGGEQILVKTPLGPGQIGDTPIRLAGTAAIRSGRTSWREVIIE